MIEFQFASYMVHTKRYSWQEMKKKKSKNKEHGCVEKKMRNIKEQEC